MKLPGSIASQDRFRVGCAGWSLAAQHAHLFGSGASMLARYATRFNAAEINSSFYRSHQQKTYARWAQSVPDDFRFSVKLPKTISHDLRLHACAGLLDGFAEEIQGLGNKMAGILVQLPPSLSFEARIASTFFAMLRRRTKVAIACEPRHASWFGAKADALFQHHAVNRVGADPALIAEAAEPGQHGHWRYRRLHGTPQIYYSDYSEAALLQLCQSVRSSTQQTRPWVIFDNTAHGHALANAARLQELLSGPLSAPGRR